jgi:hypothetical protein
MEVGCVMMVALEGSSRYFIQTLAFLVPLPMCLAHVDCNGLALIRDPEPRVPALSCRLRGDGTLSQMSAESVASMVHPISDYRFDALTGKISGGSVNPDEDLCILFKYNRIQTVYGYAFVELHI